MSVSDTPTALHLKVNANHGAEMQWQFDLTTLSTKERFVDELNRRAQTIHSCSDIIKTILDMQTFFVNKQAELE